MANKEEAERLARFLCKLDTPGVNPDGMFAHGEPVRISVGFLIPNNSRPLWTIYLGKAVDILDFLEGDNG